MHSQQQCNRNNTNKGVHTFRRGPVQMQGARDMEREGTRMEVERTIRARVGTGKGVAAEKKAVTGMGTGRLEQKLELRQAGDRDGWQSTADCEKHVDTEPLA